MWAESTESTFPHYPSTYPVVRTILRSPSSENREPGEPRLVVVGGSRVGEESAFGRPKKPETDRV
jgi:hypothetical protein